ncbi:NAD(+) synthase [Pseudacidovorax intermedius]|uniref:NAD(+) synthase n=1 Tax=Pseudacidovorax intermedius TaxID=433924 RepID=UPI000348D88E|nr:NAD(+) synthase [Pseudacidovorax intermedius]
MKHDLPFLNPYRHGFARVAVAMPRNRVADPLSNAAETIRLYREAEAQGAAVVAFPELGLSAYTCDDLFHQSALLDGCEEALAQVVEASRDLNAVAIVGAPLRVEHRLFNCAVVVARGRVLAVLPKTYLPNYGEFYEARQFNAAGSAVADHVQLFGHRVPFGTDIVVRARELPLLALHVEICEDLWTPIPPSSFAALAGATVLVNLSASNILVGKSAYRHALVGQQSARCIAAYLYTSAGIGESTTDLAWDGQSLIYECGELVAESERFANQSHLLMADVDLERLAHERMRLTSFGETARCHKAELANWRTVEFDLTPPAQVPGGLMRTVERFPYVPADARSLDERCYEVFNIQVQSLVQRLEASRIGKVVIGISGGLDSTHALLVVAQAMDRLGRPRSDILAYTMPGFATSTRTLKQAHALMRVVGCTAQEIDIRPSCRQMLADLGHPFGRGEPVYDVTFENVQAGERTSHLFRLANHHGGIVAGTGDLSELALGWCTYGVGDHMSHYNVNASVPKTLIKHLVNWVAGKGLLGEEGSQVLQAILSTEISPELVPADAESQGAEPAQSTESVVGPYELQDFHLYHTVRHGMRPSKVAYLAWCAWHDRERGPWPDTLHGERHQYTLAEIKKHLGTFLFRFFQISQFKRSCVPNAPKVGSGGSLSPRGDWRAPSDSESRVWLDELKTVPDEV